jgi:DNA polymerase IV
VIVGGKPNARGVVSACSYETRAFGVRSGMPLRTAARLCPQATFLPGRFSLYSELGRQVRDLLVNAAPLVERASIDEYYLELTGCESIFGDLETWCRQLAADVEATTGLPITFGLASNKLVAKTATSVFKKRRHTGGTSERVTVVAPGSEAAFMAPLPTRALAGVGSKTEEMLARYGLMTLGDIQRSTAKQMRQILGDHGESLRRRAFGVDERLVTPHRNPKSIGHERTFRDDVSDPDIILRMLRYLAERTASDLRRKARTATRVQLKWRYDDFETLSRSVTIPATDEALVLYRTILPAARGLMNAGRPVRLVGIRAEGLAEHHYPAGLFDDKPERRRHLLEAVDRLRERYGDDIIGPGSLQ